MRHWRNYSGSTCCLCRVSHYLYYPYDNSPSPCTLPALCPLGQQFSMPRSAAGPIRFAKGVAVVSVASYCLCAGQVHIRRRLRTAVYRAPVVAVAAGGSGSFVSPALAIAEQLTADGKEVRS